MKMMLHQQTAVEELAFLFQWPDDALPSSVVLMKKDDAYAEVFSSGAFGESAQMWAAELATCARLAATYSSAARALGLARNWPKTKQQMRT